MTRSTKRVLVVDDESVTLEDLCSVFIEHNHEVGGVFTFEVDQAGSTGEAVEKVRSRGEDAGYDVIVLDLRFTTEPSDRQGLHMAEALGVIRRLGHAIPIVIVFTGYGDLHTCVRAMRHGAWDFIEKFDQESRSCYQLVVDSAVARLRGIQQQERLRTAALEWLPRNLAGLQEKFGGQIVAIWDAPPLKVIASGKDAFDLEAALAPWRSRHPDWMYPFIIRIPENATSASLQG